MREEVILGFGGSRFGPFINMLMQFEGVHVWEQGSNESLAEDFFRVAKLLKTGEYPDKDQILAAYYVDEDYSGHATVIFHDRHGRLFRVDGNHCSCSGLEGQWNPEPTTKEALVAAIGLGTYGAGFPRSDYDPEMNAKFEQLIRGLPDAFLWANQQATQNG